MLYDIYGVADTDKEAKNIVEEIKTMGIGPKDVKLITKPDHVGNLGRESDEFHNALTGSVVGMIIGSLFGAAVLSTMGLAGIPGMFAAILLLACAALGGMMFGAIVGSTGLFARKRIQAGPPLEYHLDEEIDHGHVVVSVRAKTSNHREALIETMYDLGATDVYYRTERAA